MNIAIISGRFTDNPQSKKTNIGEDMAVFTIAINEGYGEKRRTLFVDVTAFGTAARIISTYGGKGRRVQIRGRIDISMYEKNGEKRKSFRIVAESVELIDRPERKEVTEDDIPDEMLPF